MKTLFTVVAAAGLFSLTACNSSALREKEAALAEQQRKLDAITMELARQKVVDSMNEVAQMQYSTMQPAMMPNAVQYASVAPQVRYVTVPARTTTRRRSQRSYSGYSQPVAYQQPVQQRRGWSAKAKGAVIGGAGGAIAGAVINGRNRPVGALIGGLLGAGAGTGIGAIIDKRNGR